MKARCKWMPATDEPDMFSVIISSPLHHIISVCTPLCLANSIFIDGEVLESMVAFVRALCVCVCVCVSVVEKCSSCSGNTGTKMKQCYFGSVDPRLLDGSELYVLWMGGRWLVNTLMDALLLSLRCHTYGLSGRVSWRNAFFILVAFLSFSNHTHWHRA